MRARAGVEATAILLAHFCIRGVDQPVYACVRE